MVQGRSDRIGTWRRAAAKSRRNRRLRWAAYVIAAILILVGLLDVVSTNLGLAMGAAETNPLIRLTQASLGAWWAVPKMGLHFVTAAMLLWFPRIDVLASVAAVAAIVGLVALNNFAIAGLI